MSYIINNSRGNIVAVVPDGTVNTTATSLALVGQGVLDYGTAENENYVYLLENFAKNTAPLLPILGQLWYQANTDTLHAYNSANTWAPIATQAYVEASKVSPAFTGTPTAPTAAAGTATTQIATTAFVTNSPQFAGTPTAPTAAAGTATTQLATTAFVTNSPQFAGTPTAPTATAGTATTQIATTAFVTNSPQLAGTPTAPTAAAGTATTQLATTAFVTNSPQLAGNPTAPTQAYGDNSTKIATTAFVQNEKDSPQFTGVPTAPTASPGTSTGQIATTAFVSTALSSGISGLGTMATQNSNFVNITGGNIALSNPLGVLSGGTGAGDAVNARINLGLGTVSTQNANAVTITGGTITNTVITPTTYWPITQGGTGAGTASTARTNLGLGTVATQDSAAVDITGGSITGITDLAIADGGTGASTASGARTNLGLGTMAVQNSNNVNITGGTIENVSIAANVTISSVIPVSTGGTGATNAAAARTNLGLGGIPGGFTPGTIASQNASAVAITGGTITGITDLAIADGGTGASTASGARTNIEAAWSGRSITASAGLTGGGTLSSDITISIATNSNGYGTRYISTAAPSGGSDGDIWYQV